MEFHLPSDVALKIASSLQASDISSLSCCSRFWKELCDFDSLWESLARDRWPSINSSSTLEWRSFYIQRHTEISRKASAVVKFVEQCSASAPIEVGDYLKAIRSLRELLLSFKDVQVILFKPQLNELLNLVGLHYCVNWLGVPANEVMEALKGCKISERHVCVKWWKFGRWFYGFRMRDEQQTRQISLAKLVMAEDEGFLLLPFLLPISQTYTPPDKYFINCGSDSNTKFGLNRLFVGDVKPGSLPIYPGKSKLVKDDSSSKSIPEIYHTARVYTQPTWYIFGNINENGTYLVRLHFFPLSSKDFPHLSEARFNVSASSGYQLLSNFSLEKIPVVKEFSFELKQGLFGIQFSPLKESPLAFVNAIEVFLAPPRFTPASAFPLSPEVRTENKTHYNLVPKAFEAVYRINMGGPLITSDTDTLWRTWLPDDDFLSIPSSGKNITFNGNIKYLNVTTEYTAPVSVYDTARELNYPEYSNMTWLFKVKKKTKYFVHLHWCDFVKRAPLLFNFSLGPNVSSFHTPIEFATPFRLEMVFLSDNSGSLKIGIAHNNASKSPRAFLNGVEIMELIEKSFPSPILVVPESKKHHKLLIGVLVGGVVSIVVVIGLLFIYYRARKSRIDRNRLYQEFLSQEKHSEKISITDLAPHLNLDLKIPFKEIKTATNDFDKERIIGVGGFGEVFKGTHRGKEVAVKRSRPGFGQGLDEFQTEVIVLSQIRHRHLVSLYGYCDENEEMILVYEYMERGTLREFLYGSKTDSRPSLSWKQRLDICMDAAKGLDYLHTVSAGAGGVIIHRDIKTTNILLDKNLMAKVADFGISMSGVPDPKESDTAIKGTYGYLDPECFDTGKLTEKSDVYAFGVVLLEVVSARAPIDKSLPNEEINLADWAILCISKGEIEKLIDPLLVGTMEEHSLRKFMEIAEKCVNGVGEKRPSMHDVVYDLQLALDYQYAGMKSGKGFDGSSILDSQCQWEIPSTILDRIPSIGNLEDSTVIQNDSTTINAREMAAEFKMDCAR